MFSRVIFVTYQSFISIIYSYEPGNDVCVCVPVCCVVTFVAMYMRNANANHHISLSLRQLLLFATV